MADWVLAASWVGSTRTKWVGAVVSHHSHPHNQDLFSSVVWWSIVLSSSSSSWS